MENTALCPFCRMPFLNDSTCRRDAAQMAQFTSKRAGSFYEIIPEGDKFAVSFQGDVKVHDLEPDDLPKAQWIVSILNSVIDEVEETPR